MYLAHGPDGGTPLEELAAFCAEAVATGKARHVGVSNLLGWQIAKLTALLERQGGGPRLVTHQPQYSLLTREIDWEVLPATQDAGISAIVWGPLAGGWLTGKYQRDTPPPQGSRLDDDPNRGVEAWEGRATERTWAIIDCLSAVAAELGVSPGVAALVWSPTGPVSSGHGPPGSCTLPSRPRRCTCPATPRPRSTRSAPTHTGLPLRVRGGILGCDQLILAARSNDRHPARLVR